MVQFFHIGCFPTPSPSFGAILGKRCCNTVRLETYWRFVVHCSPTCPLWCQFTMLSLLFCFTCYCTKAAAIYLSRAPKEQKKEFLPYARSPCCLVWCALPLGKKKRKKQGGWPKWQKKQGTWLPDCLSGSNPCHTLKRCILHLQFHEWTILLGRSA